MSADAPKVSAHLQTVPTPTLRAFICYAHAEDESALAAEIAEFLADQEVCATYDQGFTAGQPFGDQIKASIARAHVFIPLITPKSQERGWVHQEIGFANALNLPILPICVGNVVPGQMIERLHAVVLDNFQHRRWEERLKRAALDTLVRRYSDPALARYECAPTHEERTIMLARHAWSALDDPGLGAGCVRQRGALSSFHIPDRELTHPDWVGRYGGPGKAKGLFHCKWQLEERRAFTEHAKKAGCKLIINPWIRCDQWGAKACIVRMKCLRDFLEAAGAFRGNFQVGVDQDMHAHENLTIIGNYFAAEAVSSREYQGYRQTVLTTHAPSMESRVDACLDGGVVTRRCDRCLELSHR